MNIICSVCHNLGRYLAEHPVIRMGERYPVGLSSPERCGDQAQPLERTARQRNSGVTEHGGYLGLARIDSDERRV